MAKEKVTLTIDTRQLERLRRAVGARSLSAAVEAAVGSHLARLEHLAAVDAWLTELEQEHGPVPDDVADWASTVVSEWESGHQTRPRDGDAAA